MGYNIQPMGNVEDAGFIICLQHATKRRNTYIGDLDKAETASSIRAIGRQISPPRGLRIQSKRIEATSKDDCHDM